MSIIFHSDGILGKINGAVYGEQVIGFLLPFLDSRLMDPSDCFRRQSGIPTVLTECLKADILEE